MAVIGAGIVGLAVANEARLRDSDVVCLDPEPGTRQSAGSGRIFRYAHDSPAAARAAMRARAAWHRWEEDSGRRLLAGNGTVVLGPDAARFAAAMHDVGAPLDWYEDTGRLSHVLPAAMLERGPGLYDPAGGTIDAEATIDMLLANLGDRVVRDTALSIDMTLNGAVIDTTGERVEARQVVVATGTDTAALVNGVGITLAQETFGHARFTLPWSSPRRDPVACFLDRRRDTVAGWSFYGVPLSADLIAIGGGWGEELFPMHRYTVDEVRETSWKAVSAWARHNAPELELQEVDRVDCAYAPFPLDERRPFCLEQRGALLAVAGNDLFKFAPLVALDVCDRLRISSGVDA